MIARRRRAHNRLGFAVQLCALRYPGRLLHPGEVVPEEILTFLADQLDLAPEVLADYAVRSQTRYDQLNALYAVYGFRTFTRPDRAEMARWLLAPALGTTSGAALAGLLLEELRRRAVAAPGPTVIERLVAAALSQAERHVERQIDARLDDRRRTELDALLDVPAGAVLSPLAWARQPPGVAGHRALAQIVGQLDRLRSLHLDPAIVEAIQADRRRALSREGMRLPARHLKSLAEFGIVAPKGPANLKALEEALANETSDLPAAVRAMSAIYHDQIARLTDAIERLGDELETASRTDAKLQHLCTIPGIGPATFNTASCFVRAGTRDGSARRAACS